MAMSRAKKQDEIEAMKTRFADSNLIVVARNEGLTVAQITALRDELRENGASFKIIKNSLAKIAAKGTAYEAMTDMFTGPVGIAYSQDPVAAAKVTQKFAKDNEKLVIIGGSMGAQILDQAGVEQLSKLPSLDELRGKIIGVIQAPATKLAGVIQAPAGQLARVVGAYGAKE